MLGGLGWPETMVVLLLLALFVFGPERLPGLAADAGRALRRVRDSSRGWATASRRARSGGGDLDLRSLNPREFVRRNLFEDDVDELPDGAPRRRHLLPDEPRPWDPETT